MLTSGHLEGLHVVVELNFVHNKHKYFTKCTYGLLAVIKTHVLNVEIIAESSPSLLQWLTLGESSSEEWINIGHYS
jgi:hypothetical protein